MLAGASLIALGCTSAMAQQVTGVPSPPEATITGKQLPPPDPKFRRANQGERLGLEGIVGAARAARMLRI
jgi:hypothetical protein